MEMRSVSRIISSGKEEWLVEEWLRIYLFCVYCGVSRRFISIVCPEWKRRVARRILSIVPLMEEKSGS